MERGRSRPPVPANRAPCARKRTAQDPGRRAGRRMSQRAEMDRAPAIGPPRHRVSPAARDGPVLSPSSREQGACAPRAREWTVKRPARRRSGVCPAEAERPAGRGLRDRRQRVPRGGGGGAAAGEQ
ncbi:hypothetical protein GCM10027440_16720 [Nocardiopsis coralliicola]